MNPSDAPKALYVTSVSFATGPSSTSAGDRYDFVCVLDVVICLD